MKLLIIGAKGILGRDLSHEFRDIKPFLWDREDIDITNQKRVVQKVRELRPDIIVNAAAYTDVDGAETNRDVAMKVNGEAVKYLAEASSGLGAKFIHYSTDYVFGGGKSCGYAEGEIPKNPVNTYGFSKLTGEKYLLQKAERSGLEYFLIRTSWLFGPLWNQRDNDKNFVNKILELAETKDEIRVVNDQFGRPTFSRDLARETRDILKNLSPGIYHITNTTREKGITWYEFAKKIIELSGKKTRIIPCSSSEFPILASRPHYSIINNTKTHVLRSWEDALREYLDVKVKSQVHVRPHD